LPTSGGATMQLAGSATDDGLPGSGTTTTWTRASGPAPVTIANPASATTSVTFSVAGTYVLRLTAFDGELSSFDETTVTVEPAAATVAYYLDDFDPKDYAGNDGTLSWSGPWTEIADNNSSTSGNIYMWTSASACSPSPCPRIRAVNGNEGLERTADLSGATSARLRLDYNVYGGTEGVRLILDDGSQSVVVDTLTVAASGLSSQIDLRIEDYVSLSSTVTVRFLADGATGNRSYPDNVRIDLQP
jgi:hypothetical protein